MPKPNILDETGYSYSGIADIILNEPEKTTMLIYCIDEEYNKSKKRQAELEKELEAVKMIRSSCVSSFIYAHKALDIDGRILAFNRGDRIVVVEIKSDNKINYENYKASLKNPL